MIDVKRLIDPQGMLSPDMFGDADEVALIRRLTAYKQAAIDECAAAGLILEPVAPLEPVPNRTPLLREHILHQAFDRLATLAETRPSNQSQPEYSRSVSDQQIKNLRSKSQKHLEKHQALLNEALNSQNIGIPTLSRVVVVGDLTRS